MFNHEERELLDVVNEHDEVIDSIERADMMQLQHTLGRYIRCIELFLQRPDGDIYLPRRSPHKKLFPGSLDFSAAGHINKGESYETALVREVKEELAITCTPDDPELLATFQPNEESFYFRNLYLLRSDQTPRLSQEHTEAVWLPAEKLLPAIKNDVPAKDTLYESLPILRDFLAHETS